MKRTPVTRRLTYTIAESLPPMRRARLEEYANPGLAIPRHRKPEPEGKS